jgi:hypothetical protein
MSWTADDAQSTPVHVGTSGWSYAHWENVLYPPGLPVAQRLGRYVSEFATVELNASFYRWPQERTFAGWQRRLPPGFLLSVKAPRGLTHAKRLYAPEVWVERLTSCWHQLGDRRGVLLVQLPPGLPRDDARLEYFLRLLPDWMRVAVEFRHPSWLDDQVFAILGCTAPPRTTSPEAPTATPTWAGGPIGSATGSASGMPCSSTSTTTVGVTPSATPGPCAACSAPEPVEGPSPGPVLSLSKGSGHKASSAGELLG